MVQFLKGSIPIYTNRYREEYLKPVIVFRVLQPKHQAASSGKSGTERSSGATSLGVSGVPNVSVLQLSDLKGLWANISETP
jgi:hypothetical protein